MVIANFLGTAQLRNVWLLLSLLLYYTTLHTLSFYYFYLETNLLIIMKNYIAYCYDDEMTEVAYM